MDPDRSDDPDGTDTAPSMFDVLYVDAMNVIGSRPDGWWRDRDGAVTRFVASLTRMANGLDTEVVVVIDGHPIDGLAAGRTGNLLVVYAPRHGPDAADDRIIELLDEPSSTHDGRRIGLVTADRALRERAAVRGASVLGPRQLLAVLDRHAPRA